MARGADVWKAARWIGTANRGRWALQSIAEGVARFVDKAMACLSSVGRNAAAIVVSTMPACKNDGDGVSVLSRGFDEVVCVDDPSKFSRR